MKQVLITGGSGYIGQHLTSALIGRGYGVTIVSRDPENVKNRVSPLLKGADVISWEDDFPEVDIAIHLAGISIGGVRWSEAFVKKATDSRVQSAKTLKNKLSERCKLVISASGATCYTPNDGIAHDEDDAYGDTISAQICRKWEGVWTHWPERFVAMRTGFVVGKDAIGLKKMQPIYKARLGGVIGSGKQRMSWIAIDDLVASYLWAIEHEQIEGPVNAVAPTPATFKEFNDNYARSLWVWAGWKIPGWAMKLLYGKMAEELILADYPTTPKVLSNGGFEWKAKTIGEAFRYLES